MAVLIPDSNWYWYIEAKTQQLTLSLSDDLHFQTPYSASKLRCAPTSELAFSIEHTGYFFSLKESLEVCLPDMSDAQRLQIILNAVAVKYFCKLTGLKSWHFHEQEQDMTKMVVASLSSGRESADVLVVEQDEASATCMFLTPLTLDNGKTLAQFDTIRVSSNRLGMPLTHLEPCEQFKYA